MAVHLQSGAVAHSSKLAQVNLTEVELSDVQLRRHRHAMQQQGPASGLKHQPQGGMHISSREYCI